MDKMAIKLAKMHPFIMSEFHRINMGFVEALSLPVIQFKMMLIIAGEKSSNLSDMAKALGIAPSWASENVDKLVKKGFLERNLSEKDRRKIIIKVSPSGKDLLKNYDKFTEKYFSKFLELLGDEKLKKKLLNGFEILFEVAKTLKDKRAKV